MMRKMITFILFVSMCFMFHTHSLAAGSCVVTFEPDGGTCSETYRIYQPGQAYGELPTCMKRGHDFIGWTNQNGEYVTAVSIVKESVLLKAQYSIKSYNLIFNANGGTCSKLSATVTFQQPLGALPVPVRAGYLFAGWSPYEDGRVFVNESTIMGAADCTLYAIWQLPATQITQTAPTQSSSNTTSTTGAITIKFQKLKAASGYQIKVSTSKKFKKKNTKTIKIKKNKCTVRNLKKGKKYYVKVRAFRKNKKKVRYGKWSSVKRMKAK